jgi:hypothetical protein
MRIVLQADVAANPTAVFSAITTDSPATTWFPIRVQGHLAGGRPGSPGVGSTRSSECSAPASARRSWPGPPTRWAYRGDLGSLPLVRALMEPWTLEDHHGGPACTGRWSPTREAVGVVAALAAPLLRRLFRRAMTQLGDQAARAAGETPT